MKMSLLLCNSPQAWLCRFVNDVVQGIVFGSAELPLGCHFYHDMTTNSWEVTLFAARTEVWSGALDGQEIASQFHVDILSVCEAFDAIPTIHWQTEKISSEDELGNHLAFEGVARGFNVWLRILRSAPDWSEPGRLLNLDTGDAQITW